MKSTSYLVQVPRKMTGRRSMGSTEPVEWAVPCAGLQFHLPSPKRDVTVSRFEITCSATVIDVGPLSARARSFVFSTLRVVNQVKI